MKKTLWRAGMDFEEAFGDFSLHLAYFLRIDRLFGFLAEKICWLSRWMFDERTL